MGELTIRDEAVIAEAEALAALLGTSAPEAVRAAVHQTLEREAEVERRVQDIASAAARLREAMGGEVPSNAEIDALLYDPETGLPR